jgi:biotin transporter BioY
MPDSTQTTPLLYRFKFTAVLVSKKVRRISRGAEILVHYSPMHAVVLFLFGLGVAVLVAVIGASRQTRSLQEDTILSDSLHDEDAS